MTLRRILCPLDFSDVSAHALEHAAGLAARSGARITALHVFHPLMPRTGLPGLDAATVEVADPGYKQTQHDRVTAACAPARAAGVGVDVVVTGGEPVHGILAQAATDAADLIVIGTHGTSGVQHLIVGSVAEKVLRRAVCPVLTVPPRVGTANSGTFTRVLCAVDFSDCSLAAAAAAAALSAEAGASLTLLHVLEWPWHEPPTPQMAGVPPAQAQALADYRRYLETSAVERLTALAASSAPGLAVATTVRYGKPYGELLDVARETGADLIVLGVRGRSVLDVGFFGSTANQVVRRAGCPVLTIRA